MRLLALAFLTLLAIASFSLPARSATSASGSFAAVRAPHPLTLDPSLSDAAWQTGKLPDVGGFMNLTTRAKAQHATSVYLLYDDTNLYVGFEAEQRGTTIVAGQTTNDVGFGLDDFVGIGIDTSVSASQVYFFETTPHGIRYQQANENVRYRPQWQAAAKIGDGRWSAVMIIPLRALRIASGATQTWRFNFIRSLAAVNEHYSWAFDGLLADGQIGGGWPTFTEPRWYPTLTGLHFSGSTAATRPHPRAEIYGLGSGGRDRNQFVQSDGSFRTQNVRSTGLDISVPLTTTINFVGTLAPDFSNVEIDQQTIAPQEFRRALQEYRPFFSQGAPFINANVAPVGGFLGPTNTVFYSPGVGPFDHGEKVEGSFGKQSFGVLHFRGFDQVSGNTFDDIAFGYKHALPDRTFFYWTDGVLAHHGANTDSTVEAGLDGRNLKTGFVWGIAHSFERGSFVPQGIAHSTNGFIDVHKPNYEMLLGYNDITPNYGPLDGFTATSDIRGFNTFFNLNGASKSVKNYSLFVAGDRFLDRSGAVHQADSGIFLNATFKNGLSINGAGPGIGILRGYEIPANANCTGPTVGFSFYSGFPCYRNGQSLPFNIMGLPIGYRDGTPTPIDAFAGWGKFGSNYIHLYTVTHSRPIGRTLSLGLEYDGTYERDRMTGVLESQWLRRVSLGVNLGPDSNFTFSLRSINGSGGFAPQQGRNISAAFHKRFANGNELFVNFGTPAAPTTLDRLIVKYLLRLGGDAGT
jgi:hypothetical protein